MRTMSTSLAAVVALICCGCVPIPYRAVVRPGVEGILTDIHTRQPITGATITMSSTNFYMRNPTDHQLVSASRESTSGGKFTISPERAWRVELTPNFAPNDRTIECRLMITHPAYEPTQINLRMVD